MYQKVSPRVVQRKIATVEPLTQQAAGRSQVQNPGRASLGFRDFVCHCEWYKVTMFTDP